MSTAVASNAPGSSDDGLGSKAFPRADGAIRDRATWDLFSPDGRYVILDDLVIDLETKTRIAFDCDLKYFAWYAGPRVACIVPAHTALAVLDLRDRRLTTHACDAVGPLDYHFNASERFAICGEESRATGTLVDVETGSTHVVPGSARRVWEEGGRTFALLAQWSQERNGDLNQLWDVSEGKPLGEPYLTHDGMNTVSPDGRWALGATRDEGQFIVDLKTGARRSVGAAKELPNAMLGHVAPFSPDSKRVALFAGGSGVRIVEVATGTVWATLVAPGCETAINPKFGPRADIFVVGGTQSNVCAFSLKNAKLLWRADLQGRTSYERSGGWMQGVEIITIDTPSAYVRSVEFTRDAEGIVATGDTDSSRGWGVLIRASTGEIVTAFPEKDVWRDADGDLLTTGFLFGPKASFTRRTDTLSLTCDRTNGPSRPCLKGQVPEQPPWREAYILSVDAKGQRVAGVVGGRLRVWSVTGELIYAQ